MATAYEVASGSAIAQVEGFCRHLTASGTFSTLSQPTRVWVQSQLDLDAAYIAAKLTQAGYSLTQTDGDVLQLLQLWNVLRTAVAIELSNPVEGRSGEGNARFREFVNQLKSVEDVATGPGLADLGATELAGGPGRFLTATGVSRDRKETVEEDTDHIKHRFRRGQFVYFPVLSPTADVDAGTDELL